MNLVEKEYVNEKTFFKEVVLIPEELCDLAVELHKKFGNHGPVIVGKDKKSLCFSVNKAKERVSKDSDQHLYRVCIEKIE